MTGWDVYFWASVGFAAGVMVANAIMLYLTWRHVREMEKRHSQNEISLSFREPMTGHKSRKGAPAGRLSGHDPMVLSTRNP